MRKIFILLVLCLWVFYALADKFNEKKKTLRSTDESFDRAKMFKHPADIIESVHSDIPGDPQIKIRFAGAEDSDDEATISLDNEPEDDDDDEDDEEDIVPIKKKKKLPKSKTEDIHSFL